MATIALALPAAAVAKRNVYLTNQSDGSVSAFNVAADGSLSAVPGSPFPTGSSPQGVALTPDDSHLYIANAGSNDLAAFNVAADGSLSAIAGSPFATGSSPSPPRARSKPAGGATP